MNHAIRRAMLKEIKIDHDFMHLKKEQWDADPFIYFPCKHCHIFVPVWKPDYRIGKTKVAATCTLCEKKSQAPRDLVDQVNYLLWIPGFRRHGINKVKKQ